MKLGISLSPGGLLYPYHLGVMDCLEYNNFLTAATPLAGSSAGAIAAATKGCGIKSTTALQATIEMSDACHALGGARGRLIPLLQNQLHEMIGDEQFDYLQNRPGRVGIAYRELFPNNRPIVETDFETSCDLKRAVCHSSTFPFFSTNWPVGLDWTRTETRPPPMTATAAVDSSSRTTLELEPAVATAVPTKVEENDKEEEETTTDIIEKPSSLLSTSSTLADRLKIPRVVVDGFFTVPRDRFGCPDFDEQIPHAEVDRTVCVSVFPQDLIGLTAVSPEDCISPQYDESYADGGLQNLLRLATQASSAKELTQVYEDGWKDAERWCRMQQDKAVAAAAAAAREEEEQERLIIPGRMMRNDLN